jgi:hypothetical protein
MPCINTNGGRDSILAQGYSSEPIRQVWGLALHLCFQFSLNIRDLHKKPVRAHGRAPLPLFLLHHGIPRAYRAGIETFKILLSISSRALRLRSGLTSSRDLGETVFPLKFALQTSPVHSKDRSNRKTRFLVSSFLEMTLGFWPQTIWQVWKPVLRNQKT